MPDTGWKKVTLEDIKVAYDNRVAEDAGLLLDNRLIEFVEPERTAEYQSPSLATTWYKRLGNRFTFNGTYSQVFYWRLYGTASYAKSSTYNFANNNPGCVTFTPGHTYALTATLVSGDITHDSRGAHHVRLYKAGTNELVSTLYPTIVLTTWRSDTRNRYTEFAIPENAEELTYGVYFYCSNRTTATDAVFEINLYDVTDHNPFNASAIAPSERVVAKADHSVGNLILLGGQLYRVTTAFNAGDTITTSMISKTTVADQIAALTT